MTSYTHLFINIHTLTLTDMHEAYLSVNWLRLGFIS